MARDTDDDATSAVPEADRLEQSQPADPRLSPDADLAPFGAEDGDPGDLLEQAQPVTEDPDEDYPPDTADEQ
jgi:hypothetical protein